MLKYCYLVYKEDPFEVRFVGYREEEVLAYSDAHRGEKLLCETVALPVIGGTHEQKGI